MNSRIKNFLPKKSDFQLKPVLAESAGSRFFSFSLLYFAQGVPEGLTFFAIPAWLAMNGVSSLIIGSYVAMVALPWSLKLILAPLMDRFTIKSMGRKRPWVLFGQIGLVGSFLAMSALPDPLENIGLLMTMGFIISFFGCFQDVATDSMAVDIIPLNEQARANGLMWGSKVIGTSISLAVGTFIINKYDFSTGLFVPATFTSLLILVPLYFLERRGEKRLPWTKGQASTMSKILQPANFWQILRDTYRVASRFSSLILIGIMFLIGFALAYGSTLFPMFTIQELGWDNGEYSNLYASASLVGGILGMLIAGALVDFFGKKKMLFIYLILWVASFGLFLFYQLDWFGFKMASFTIFAIRTAATFSTIAVFTVCMAHCWKRVSATQFTLYMTISNLGRSAGAASVGYVREILNWHYTFAVVLLVLIVAILLVGFIRIRQQLTAIDRLETAALEKARPIDKPEALIA